MKWLILFLLVSTSGSASVFAASYVLPADSKVLNVHDFGAVGDGKTDDTAAIQAAIVQAHTTNRYSYPPFVYLPIGVYRITAPLQSRDGTDGKSGGWRAGMLLLGEDRERTILRLDDGAPGYGDAKKPQAVIRTGSENDSRVDNPGGGNRAFLHSVMNMTIDVGAKNPGAIGIDWMVSNRGTIEDVTLRAGPDSGWCGIAMERPWPGPAMISSVRIDGFAYGLRIEHYQFGITIEHLTLNHQRILGMRNTLNSLWIRGLISDNTVPVYDCSAGKNDGSFAMLVLTESKLSGGDDQATALILGTSKALLRDIQVQGYGTAYSSADANQAAIAGLLTIDEIAVGTTSGASDGPVHGLRLPVRETPQFSSDRADDWISVVACGATPQGNGWPEDGGSDDDAPAIQKAIDSGKPIVYFPAGQYTVRQPIIIRGAVRKLMGMQASISLPDELDISPMIRFESCGGDFVVIEHLRIDFSRTRTTCGIEHASAQDLVLRHCDLPGYQATPEARGAVFFHDVRGNPLRIGTQNAWGRQVDPEFGDVPLIENNGGNLWILGLKTEGEVTAILTRNGKTELLGGLLYPLTKERLKPEWPAFRNEGGEVSLTYRINGKYTYPLQLIGQRTVPAKTVGHSIALLTDGHIQP